MEIQIDNKKIPIKKALTFHERLLGLMGKTNIQYGILFPKCNSIHTFFMKEAIDVIGLDLENNILFIERNCKKNKIIRINRPEKKTQILELPKNSTVSLNIGKKLFFLE